MRQDLDSCGRGNDGLEGEKPPVFLARMFANNFIDGKNVKVNNGG